MVRLNIGKIDSKKLKTESIKLNLPVMKRKWSRII